MLLAGSAASADEGALPTALPCRPTIACTTELVPPGTLELEAGYLRRTAPRSIQNQTPLLLKFTAVERLQLQLATNGAVLSQQPIQGRYLDDLVLLVKGMLREQTPRAPAVDVSVAGSIPVWPDAPGFQRTWDAFATVYVTKDFAWLHADFNAGLNLWRVNDPRLQGYATLALTATLPRGFAVMGECYGFTDAAPVSSRDAGFLAAVSYSPVPFLVLDAGADVGLIQSVRSYNLFAGLTVVLGRFRGAAVPRAARAPAPPTGPLALRRVP